MVNLEVIAELKEEAFYWLDNLPEGTELIVSAIERGIRRTEEYYKDLEKVKALLEDKVVNLEDSRVECDLERDSWGIPNEKVYVVGITSPEKAIRIELRITLHSYFEELIGAWEKKASERKQRFSCCICGEEPAVTYYSDAYIIFVLMSQCEEKSDSREVFEITEVGFYENGGIFVGTSEGDRWSLEPLPLEEDPSLDKHGNLCGMAGIDEPFLVPAEDWEVVSEWALDDERELDVAVEELLKPYGIDAWDWKLAYDPTISDTYEEFLADNPQFAEVSSLLGQYPFDGEYSYALFVKKESVADFKAAYLAWVRREALPEA